MVPMVLAYERLVARTIFYFCIEIIPVIQGV